MNKYLKDLNQPAIYGPFIVLALIGFFAPADVLLRSSIVASFVGFFAGFVPAIAKYPEQYALGQVLALFWSVAIALLPIQAVWIWRHRQTFFVSDDEYVRRLRGFPPLVRISMVVLAPFLPLLVFTGVFFATEDPGFCPGCTIESRLGLVLIGAGCMIGVVASLFAAATLLRNSRRLLFEEIP